MHEQEGTEDVDTILRIVFLNCDVLNLVVDRDAGIVDDDVYLEFSRLGVRKVVLCGADQMCRSCLLTEIGLHDECGDPVLLL